MKKIFSFLTIALIAICAFSFASCSSDDDDEKFSTSDVIGTWVTTSVQTSDGIWVDLTNPLYAVLMLISKVMVLILVGDLLAMEQERGNSKAIRLQLMLMVKYT